MTTSATPQNGQTVRILHLALLAGLVVISAVFLLLVAAMHVGPLLVAGDGTRMIGYVLAACALIPMVVGLVVLKPRIPTRSSGQDDTAFWRVALGPAIALWACIEGSGVVAAVGALLTGSVAPAIVVVLAIGSLVIFRPGYFENN